VCLSIVVQRRTLWNLSRCWIAPAGPARQRPCREALALTESDLDRARGSVMVRHGKGGKRREVGIDRWAWEQLDAWLELRTHLPVGVFCVLRGPTRGRPCAPAGIRGQLRATAEAAGVRRRFAPHQLRHAHAVEMSREGSRCWSSRDSSVIQTSGSPRPTPRDRQHRDHPHRPRTTRTHDPCHQPNHTPPLSPQRSREVLS
jgi:integrase